MEIKKLVVGEIHTNCYLLISKGEMAVVDPGGDVKNIVKAIKAAAAEVKYIINTHYHFDHVLVNKELKRKVGGLIMIHEFEKPYIEFKADKFLKDKTKIVLGDEVMDVLLTPGHSAGSICLKGEDYILTGDTLFLNGYGRTDLPGGSENKMKESLLYLSNIIRKRMIVYPGHGEIFEA